MGDGQHGALLELFGDNFLDDGIIFGINVGSGLIDEDYPRVFQKSSADAEQLFFTS